MLIAGLVVTGIAMGRSEATSKVNSGQAAAEAGRNLGQAAGISYSGTYGAKPAVFAVTKAGSAYGSFTTGSPVRQVEVDGTVYLRADAAFWSAHGLSADSAMRVGGRWAKAMDSVIGMRVAYLSPPSLAGVLQQAGNDPHARNISVGGRPAIEMTSGSITYDISRSEPRRLLRLKGTAGDDRFSLGAVPLRATDMGSVFARLRGDVQGLQDAFDPGITALQQGPIRYSACGESGCTVRGTVIPTADKDVWSDTGVSRITMNVSFGGGEPGAATCAGTGVSEGVKVTITCRASGAAWSSWYRAQHRPNNPRATVTFDAKVNSAADMHNLFAGIVLEQATG